MKEIALNHVSNVTCYGYGKMCVVDAFIYIYRFSEIGKTLENLLCSKSHSEIDNHVVYTIELHNGATLHIECSDDSLIIGTRIERVVP